MIPRKEDSGGYVGHSGAHTLALVAVLSHGDLAHGVRTTKERPSVAIVASSATGETRGRQDASVGLKNVEVREPGVLQEIFAASAEVRELVLESARELERAFGAHAEIAVEPFVDPEISGASPHVVVIAVTSLPFEQADEILDSVLEGWWLDNQSRGNYLVSLATELI